jgi:fused signal recognition particle receptor
VYWPALELILGVGAFVGVIVGGVVLAIGFARAASLPPPGPPVEEARPAPPAAVEPPVVPPRPRPVDWVGGLRKTRVAFVDKLEGLLRGKRELDAKTLEDVEGVLFAADIGVRTAQELLDVAREAESPEKIRAVLEARALEILRQTPVAADRPRGFPHVVLVVGVNGSGKTTTVGKLAARWMREGQRVVIAAADTFRAAAVDQLEVWAERSGAEFVRASPGGDPAAVAFDAVRAGKARGVDTVIVDTAGRLQTRSDLMDELSKIARAVKKEVPDGPHEVLLVLDANVGQNAIRQATEFTRAADVSGIVLAKLDGTAKGGVVLGIAQEVGIPVQYAGLGEGIDDLADFDPEAFVRALFEAGSESNPSG